MADPLQNPLDVLSLRSADGRLKGSGPPVFQRLLVYPLGLAEHAGELPEGLLAAGFAIEAPQDHQGMINPSARAAVLSLLSKQEKKFSQHEATS